MEAQADKPAFDFVGAREQGVLLTTAEAARIIGCTAGCVRDLRHKGQLRGKVYGRSVFIYRDSINDYMPER